MLFYDSWAWSLSNALYFGVESKSLPTKNPQAKRYTGQRHTGQKTHRTKDMKDKRPTG